MFKYLNYVAGAYVLVLIFLWVQAISGCKKKEDQNLHPLENKLTFRYVKDSYGNCYSYTDQSGIYYLNAVPCEKSPFKQ